MKSKECKNINIPKRSVTKAKDYSYEIENAFRSFTCKKKNKIALLHF